MSLLWEVVWLFWLWASLKTWIWMRHDRRRHREQMARDWSAAEGRGSFARSNQAPLKRLAGSSQSAVPELRRDDADSREARFPAADETSFSHSALVSKGLETRERIKGRSLMSDQAAKSAPISQPENENRKCRPPEEWLHWRGATWQWAHESSVTKLGGFAFVVHDPITTRPRFRIGWWEPIGGFAHVERPGMRPLTIEESRELSMLAIKEYSKRYLEYLDRVITGLAT